MLPVTADGVEYAGFGVRAGARIIDVIVAVVLGAIGGAVGGVISALVGVVAASGVAGRGRGLGAETVVPFLFGTFASIAYHTLSEGLGGASVGKLALGLRVRRSDLSPCTVGSAIGRTLAYYIDSFFFGLVAYSSMSKSPRQQRLGDKWAHTVVVKNATMPAGAPVANVGLGIALGAIGHVVLSMTGVLFKFML
jgi:uncharacterized RDD family membrane protein YckC